MKILIIANARWKDGLSGSDAIYSAFVKYWPCEKEVWEMMDIDFKPFSICYAWRIIKGCLKALFCFKRYDFVYSASDFLMDSLPAFIMKLKGNKWIAGFYLYAYYNNKIYYYTQKGIIPILKRFADIISITNGSMTWGFPNKPRIVINGGIDLSLAGLSDEPKIYDCVFCGRLHPSKGIDELIDIWGIVRKYKPDASLALIGDGDLGKKYIADKLIDKYGGYNGVILFGFMGNERYKIYKKSKIVLYPATLDHFSMAPVEAMACGCPMIAFDLPVMKVMKPKGAVFAKDKQYFAQAILSFLQSFEKHGFPEYIGDLHYKSFSSWAYDWAFQHWDYKTQALKKWQEINDVLKGQG